MIINRSGRTGYLLALVLLLTYGVISLSAYAEMGGWILMLFFITVAFTLQDQP